MKSNHSIKALSQNFLSELYNDWTNQPKESSLKDFLKNIKIKYDLNNQDYFVKGETGIFYDPNIINEINTKPKSEMPDITAAELLFYGKTDDPGLYKIDASGKKIPLSYLNATDPRIWNYISLFILNEYIQSRWDESSDTKRIFLNTFTRGNISRHAISRLYWSGFLCYEESNPSERELLTILWTEQDFMTQVTERKVSISKQHLQQLLRFCGDSENYKTLFKSKTKDGYSSYRAFLKLMNADYNLYSYGCMDSDKFQELCRGNLDLCTIL
jgi:hypothetical protein